MNPTIRPATPADAADLARLAGQLGYPCDAVDVERRLASELGNPKRQVLVAESAGSVAGWVSAEFSEHFYMQPDVVISGLVVDEACRGAGIGKKLLREVEQWALQKGLGRVRLRSSLRRAEAHAFYQAQGYAVAKQQLAFVKELQLQ